MRREADRKRGRKEKREERREGGAETAIYWEGYRHGKFCNLSPVVSQRRDPVFAKRIVSGGCSDDDLGPRQK